MNLQTLVDIPKFDFNLNYKDKGLFVGSCFAESLQKYLSYRKADAVLCPYGEMYNPVSINSFFSKHLFSEDDVVKSKDGLWYSWYHHGSIYSEDKNTLIEKINMMCDFQLSDYKYVVITLGTAWVYELMDGRVISNCHKMPQTLFRRRCLSLEEILSALRNVVSLLTSSKIVITVSPIRHIKDGLTENSYSKSLLRVAAGILESENKGSVYYYPSYEIMNDELRDYRFYREDMLHPTEQASSYIMEQFVNSVFDDSSKTFFQDVLKLRHAMEHRPLHAESVTYKNFRKYLTDLYNEIVERYPDVYFGDISLK